MKALVFFVALSLMLASDGVAAEIEGKWGLGAGVFNTRVGEMTLIRGRSNRSAWLLDFQLRDDRQRVGGSGGFPIPVDQDRRQSFITGGPGLRSYTRADADLSPYWDVMLVAVYFRNRSQNGGGTSSFESLEGGARFNLGVEYFTPWKVSFAAHSTILSATWSSIVYRTDGGVLGSTRSTGESWDLLLGLSTALGARIYF